ncbi:MAG: DNA-processing protein DprA [Bacteroidales bacterium]|nr:DNA-processing protein DprA [Bacteroidales bacterium]
MSYSDTSVALCALNKLFGYQPAKALTLMERVTNPVELFDGSFSQELNGGQLEWARRELARVESEGTRFVSLLDDDYPVPLTQLPDPPMGLYMSATSSPTEVWGLRPMIAIVGTRDISPYGKEWCRKLVEALAEAPVQPCIVSGLAYGADGIAHQSALEHGLGTIGVMATGIDTVYPWQHRDLARQMVGTGGCALITDYPLETSPVANNFLRRNRIIAGLCSATLVVESKSRGGSLMTARYAVEYNRDVYALPGRVDDIRSAGCNSLIANEMARIITTIPELVGQLGLGARLRGPGGSWSSTPTAAAFRHLLEETFPSGTPGPGGAPGLGRAPVTIGMAIRSHRGITADELSALTALPISTVVQCIGLLEAHGFISTDLLRRCSLTAPYA